MKTFRPKTKKEINKTWEDYIKDKNVPLTCDSVKNITGQELKIRQSTKVHKTAVDYYVTTDFYSLYEIYWSQYKMLMYGNWGIGNGNFGEYMMNLLAKYPKRRTKLFLID